MLAVDAVENGSRNSEPSSKRRNRTQNETEVNQHTPVSNSVELRPAPARTPENYLPQTIKRVENNSSLRITGFSADTRQTPLVNSLNFGSFCRYSCLEPLLPALKNIIPAEEACDLLDIYFVEPGNSLFSIHSPYVLTPVLRKKSLLSSTNPRPTSPALLSTILWCMAHTANISSFRIPGSRERIINKFFSLSLSFFRERDMDNWHRVPGIFPSSYLVENYRCMLIFKNYY